MTLKMKLTIGVGLIVTILFSAISFYSNYEMVKLVEEQEEDQYTMVENLVKREMDQQLETARISVETVAKNLEVQRLFANRDRESLLEDLLPVYDQIKDQVAQFQFHLPDSTSFLRLHKPLKYGDSLKDFRYTVNECNQSQKIVMGLEEGVAGFGFRVVMPMFYQGKHTGSVEYGLNFQEEFLSKLKESHDGQYLIYQLTDSGTKGSEMPKLLSATVEEDLWKTPQEKIDQVRAGQVVTYHSAKKHKGIMLIPFVDYTDTVKGYIKVILDREEILQMIKQINHKLLIISLICILSILALIYIMISQITKNLDDVIQNIQEISTGKLHLRVKAVRSRDELSKLSVAFNQMISKFQTVVQEIRSTSGQLSRSSSQLNQVTASSSAAAEEVGASIEEVSQRSYEQSILMDEATQLVQEMSKEVTDLGNASQEARQVAMTNASHVQESKQAVNQIQTQMEEIQETMGGTAGVVTELIERSSQIGKIVEIINGIANQTQLLALNAAIEAARAGESGRGFSVVADEIKQLAEGTVDSAKEITTLIAETINGSNNVKTAMEKGLDKVQVGNEVVHSTSTIFNQMVTASEANLEFIASTSEGIQQVVQLNQQILEKISAVASIAQETASSAEEVSASTEEQIASTEEVANSAEQLQKMAQELEGLIQQFVGQESSDAK